MILSPEAEKDYFKMKNQTETKLGKLLVLFKLSFNSDKTNETIESWKKLNEQLESIFKKSVSELRPDCIEPASLEDKSEDEEEDDTNSRKEQEEKIKKVEHFWKESNSKIIFDPNVEYYMEGKLRNVQEILEHPDYVSQKIFEEKKKKLWLKNTVLIPKS